MQIDKEKPVDVDVKEIESDIESIREYSRRFVRSLTGEWLEKSAFNMDLLLTKYTETLAQVERLEEELRSVRPMVDLSLPGVREQLDQVVEALKQISRLDACGNHTLIKGVVRDTLQLIGEDEEDAGT